MKVLCKSVCGPTMVKVLSGAMLISQWTDSDEGPMQVSLWTHNGEGPIKCYVNQSS